MTDKLVPTDLNDSQLAKTFANSGFWKDARDANKAMVKILGGREIGIGPMASMREIDIIKGKIELSSSLMARLVKESEKYNYVVSDHTEDLCVIDFYERMDDEWKQTGSSEFTMEDAKNAELTGKDNWQKYPKNMLFARALSNGVKWYCPDVTGGSVYHKGEISQSVNGTVSVERDRSEVEEEDEEEEVIDADYEEKDEDTIQTGTKLHKAVEATLKERGVDREQFKKWIASLSDKDLPDEPSMKDMPKGLMKRFLDNTDGAVEKFEEWKDDSDDLDDQVKEVLDDIPIPKSVSKDFVMEEEGLEEWSLEEVSSTTKKWIVHDTDSFKDSVRNFVDG